MVDNDKFSLVKKLEYTICVLKKVEQEIISMKDGKAKKKVL